MTFSALGYGHPKQRNPDSYIVNQGRSSMRDTLQALHERILHEASRSLPSQTQQQVHQHGVFGPERRGSKTSLEGVNLSAMLIPAPDSVRDHHRPLDPISISNGKGKNRVLVASQLASQRIAIKRNPEAQQQNAIRNHSGTYTFRTRMVGLGSTSGNRISSAADRRGTRVCRGVVFLALDDLLFPEAHRVECAVQIVG